jgi:hypothetical protein
MDIFCTCMNKSGCRGNPGWLPSTRFYHDSNIDKKSFPPFRKQKLDLAGLISVNSVLLIFF